MVSLDGRVSTLPTVTSSAKSNSRQKRKDSFHFNINRMITKFKDVFEDIVGDQKLAVHSTVIETDFERDKYEDKIGKLTSSMNNELLGQV